MPSPRRIVLFTSQEIGHDLVAGLVERKDLDLFVVTDRTNRDIVNGYRSPIEACERHGVPFVQATRVSPDLLARLTAFAPGLILSAYFPHILGADVRGLAPAVNVHPGILPRYRGRFPTPWYILNGEATFGIAVHRLDEGIDTGDVLVQAEYPMPPAVTGNGLYRLTQSLAATLVMEHLDALFDGQLPARPQTGAGSYYSRIEPRFHIDWNSSATMIERRVRVHAKPYFPTFAFLLNRMILINRARIAEREGYSAQGVGRIVAIEPDGAFLVSCSDGLIRVEDYEFAPALSDEAGAHLLSLGAHLE